MSDQLEHISVDEALAEVEADEVRFARRREQWCVSDPSVFLPFICVLFLAGALEDSAHASQDHHAVCI